MDTNPLMVGRQEVAVNGLVTETTIPMERLVSRLDVYMFKSRRLKVVRSLSSLSNWSNQVVNTRGEYQNTIMVSPVKKRNDLRTISNNNVLDIMPEDMSGITPG